MSKKKTTKIIAVCASLAIVAGAFLGATAGEESDVVEEPVDSRIIVETRLPVRGNIAVTGEYIGTVEPGQQVTVYPKTAGEVLSANFQVGDSVEQGAVLCQLDSTTLQFTIAQTQAAIASAEAKAQYGLEVAQENLETYKANVAEGTNASLLAAEAAVLTAENGVESAVVNLRTARSNYNDAKDGLIYNADGSDYTDQQITALRDVKRQAEITLEKAQLGLEQAKENLEAAKVQVRDQETSVKNSVKSAELNTDFSDQYIALQKLQKDLNDAVITAPISGIIEQRNVDPFDMASPQSPVYVISNKDLMMVSFKIPEASLAHMRAGDGLTIDKDGQTWPGVITEIATMADSGSGLFTVKASVENAPFDIRSGSTLKIYADAQRAENCVTISIDALYYDNGMPYVYLVKDGFAVKTPVTTGISDAENVEITSGLTLTDEIITTWSSKLSDGAEILRGLDLDTEAETPLAGEPETAEEAPETEESQAEGESDGSDAAPAGEEEGQESLSSPVGEDAEQ